MKPLKIFSNAFLAGVYGSFLYLLLVFYVNPALRLNGSGFFSLFPFLGIPFALVTAALWTGCMLAVRPFWTGSLAPRWIGFRYTMWMLVVNLFLLSLLYGASRWRYQHLLPPPLRRVLLISSVIVLGLGLILTVVVLAGSRRTRRGRRLGIVLGLVLGLFLLWWLRAAYPRQDEVPSGAELPEGIPAPGTFILGIGSASMDLILPLIAEGKLPAISHILRDGSGGRLRGFRPAAAGALWASLSTGKYPYQHGRYGDRRFRILGSGIELDILPWGFPEAAFRAAGLLRDLPAGGRPRRALAFWEILGKFGDPVLAGPWGGSGGDPAGDSGAGAAGGKAPPDGLTEWESAGLFAIEEAIEELSVPGGPLDEEIQEALQGELVEAIGADLAVVRRIMGILDAGPPRVLAARLDGLGWVSRMFLRFHRPEEFGNVPAEITVRYGGVLEAYYRFLDDACGLLRSRLPEGGRMFVVSPVGIEPVRFPARILSRIAGASLASGSISRAPDGLLLAVGEGIRGEVPLAGATLYDFLPTLLYSLHLPVGRDLPGRPLIEIFREDFARRHPVSLIPSYETVKVGPRGPADPPDLSRRPP